MSFRNNKNPVPCIICGQTINLGDEIAWSRRNPEKGNWHPACAGKAPSTSLPEFEYETVCKWTTICSECKQPISEGSAIVYNSMSHKARHIHPCAPSSPVAAPQPVQPVQTAQTAPATPSTSPDALTNLLAQALNVPAQIQAAIAPAIAQMQAATPSPELINKLVSDAIAKQQPERVIHVIQQPDKPAVEIKDATHKLFPLVLKTISTRDHIGYLQNIALYGESGAGKTHLASQIAQALAVPYYYISLNPQTPESRLVGYMDATGKYIPSLLYKAYTEGGVYLFDEYDNASGALLNTLNSALANGKGAFPCGMVQQHKDFVAIAATNTPGFGASGIYTDRRAIDNAARQRFAWLEFNTDEQLETRLATLNSPSKGQQWAAYVQQVRKWAKKELPKLLVTQRASIKGAAMLESGHDVQHVFNCILAMGFDKDSISKLLAANPLPRL